MRQRKLIPEYVCQSDGADHIISVCQRLLGEQVDQAVSQLLIEAMTPLALEVTLAVQREIETGEEVDRLRKKAVERAQYEADLAQRRYLHVDPANGLSLILSRQTGIISCGPCRRPSRSMSNAARVIGWRSRSNSVPVSPPWLLTFLAYGKIRILRIASASGWYGYCWRM
jgi:hypothetical protein